MPEEEAEAFAGNALARGTMLKTSHGLSPMILSEDWPWGVRVFILLSLSMIGTALNGFFLASFRVEHTLKTKSQIYMALTGVSNLTLSCVILPCVLMVLMTGRGNDPMWCSLMQSLFEAVTYSYNMFFMLMSLEFYYRICRPEADYDCFMSAKIGLLCSSVYTLSLSLAFVGVFFNLDYNYCDPTKEGAYGYRLLTSIMFYAIPAATSFIALSVTFFEIKRRLQRRSRYRLSEQGKIDCRVCGVNIVIYSFYIVFWIPYLKLIHGKSEFDETSFYKYAWIGICNSIFNVVLYPIFAKNYKRAFALLFNYFFCREPLTNTPPMRRRRHIVRQVNANELRGRMMELARRPVTLRAVAEENEINDL